MSSRILTPLLAAALIALAAPTLQAGPDDAESPGYLGVRLQRVEGGLAEALDMDDDSGVLLGQVMDESPADEAGLRSGDIVVKVDGDDVGSPGDLQRAVRARESGEAVKIEYLRDGKSRTATVTLGESPARGKAHKVEKYLREPKRIVRDLKLGKDHGFLGVVTQPLSGGLGEFFGVEGGEGALVSEIVEDSPAEELGLKAGDVIVRVGDQAIDGPDGLRRAIRKYDEVTEVEIGWVRGQKNREGTTTIEIQESRGRSPHMFSWRSEVDGELEGLHTLDIDLEGLEDLDLREHLGKLRHHVGDGMEEIRRVEIHEEVGDALEELRAQLKELKAELRDMRDRQESE